MKRPASEHVHVVFVNQDDDALQIEGWIHDDGDLVTQIIASTKNGRRVMMYLKRTYVEQLTRGLQRYLATYRRSQTEPLTVEANDNGA